MSTTATTRRQVCTFRLEGGLYGLDVAAIQEVLKHRETTAVPLAPALVSGLINLRGQIVTAIDLRLGLGLPPTAAGSAHGAMGLVVRTADGPFCLRVDAVCDVVVLDDASIEPPPASLDPAARALVRGVALCDEGVVLLLDLDALLRAIDGATDKVG